MRTRGARDAAPGVGVEEQRVSVKRAGSAKEGTRWRLYCSSRFPLLTFEVSAVSPLTDVDALFRAGVQSRHRF